MKRIGRLLLVGLLTGGLLGGCSEENASTLPAEPGTAGPADEANLRLGVISFDVPGADRTVALDINDLGVIVGRYIAGGVVHGFLRRRTGEFVTIDVPGSVFTVAAGINDQGDIVGQYASADDPDGRHGYVLRKGKFTSFDPEGSGFTNGLGINELGDITGRFFLAEDEDGGAHGFRLRRGSFTVVNVPRAVETNLWRSNNLGSMVGGYIDAHDRWRAFVVKGRDFKTFRAPRGKPVSMDNGDINSRGDVVGTFCDEGPPCSIAPEGNHGFLFTNHGQKLTVIDVPGAASTSTVGMNELGDIVGVYIDTDGGVHGFLMPRRVPFGIAGR